VAEFNVLSSASDEWSGSLPMSGIPALTFPPRPSSTCPCPCTPSPSPVCTHQEVPVRDIIFSGGRWIHGRTVFARDTNCLQHSFFVLCMIVQELMLSSSQAAASCCNSKLLWLLRLQHCQSRHVLVAVTLVRHRNHKGASLCWFIFH